MVHANKTDTRAYLNALSSVMEDYAEASERFRNGEFNVEFPPNTFPPARPFEESRGPDASKILPRLFFSETLWLSSR